MSIIAFSKLIGPVPIDVVVSEKHNSELEITGNTVEIGSEVHDHAYLKPKSVILEVADSNAAAVFNTLTKFQESRVPFFLVTGLTIYRNMLIQSIEGFRDKKYSRVFKGTVICREIVFASSASVPASNLSSRPTSSPGVPGGSGSNNAAAPSISAPGDVTSSPVQVGDSPTNSVPSGSSTSLLKGIFG